MDKKLLDYYAGDEFPAGVWKGKYSMKSEITPKDMHWRMTYELSNIEHDYWSKDKLHKDLSKFGKELYKKLGSSNPDTIDEWIFSYLDKFKYIIPQGSIMTMLGNTSTIGSLSNCFVIPPPLDSYGGIFKTDNRLLSWRKDVVE